MSVTTYPNLGFDPCPGSPESVSAFTQRVSTAAQGMQSANELMNRLRNDGSGVWQGDAGDAFRSHLNATLIDDLNRANQSLNTAVTALQGWGTSLGGFKERAADLESQATEAQQRLTAANDAQRRAAGNPDLGLAGQYFDTPDALADAQRRLDAATMRVRQADDEVAAAQDALEAVRKAARELQDEWDSASGKVAGELRRAAEFAPHKPGLLSRIGHDIADGISAVSDWVSDHLDDIHAVLSTVATVAGLLALVTPPPIDAIALGVSVVAGVGALATSIADPKVRGDLGEILHGDVKGNWGSVLQVGGDVAGLIPGFGLAKGAIKGGRPFLEIATEVAQKPGIVVNQIYKNVPAAAAFVEKVGLVGANATPQEVLQGITFAKRTFDSVKKEVKLGVELFGDDDE
ncbi:WXG100 family type VII secretion target [Actinoplanes sp. N902-109]|uniref:WXG100 family type VII secretion target n=1 Tax=Actinoplanes sp. (strain N902-109) TaxID=649831 RepID=UPI0003296802|nr:hypothetical protein [Actinoplanes sp. N902-109]AGL18953.1 integral membrane protein [Actinoplanes sp. N902-109]